MFAYVAFFLAAGPRNCSLKFCCITTVPLAHYLVLIMLVTGWNHCRFASLWTLVFINSSNGFLASHPISFSFNKHTSTQHAMTIQRQQQQQHALSTATSPEIETHQDIQHVDGIRDVVNDFDVYLLDMWGVMHDGSKPYEGVLDTIQHLKNAGKKLVILSNSSKRQDNSVRMLRKLGFDPNDFDQIITSGELSYRMLAGDKMLQCKPWSVLEQSKGKKVFCLGSGSQDAEYLESCGWTLASVEEADLIVARGTFTIVSDKQVVDKEDSEDEYFAVLDKSLQEAARRQIPMLVTNPDKVRPDEGLPPMPGAIGDVYEAVLETDKQHLIKRVGKPFRDVYDLALSSLDTDMSRVCMVGDALETDVTGASRIGCTAIWVVQDGIHGPDIIEKGNGILRVGTAKVLEEFNKKEGTYAGDKVLSPSICVPHFRW